LILPYCEIFSFRHITEILTQRKEKIVMAGRWSTARVVQAHLLGAGVLGAVLFSLPSLATAQVETAQSIRAAIAAAVAPRLAVYKGGSVEVTVGTIDPRLRLPACPAPEIALPPVNTATMTAKVDCPTPSWTIYVPVRLHAWVDAVVASVNLAPETRLDADDLTRGPVDMFAAVGGLLTNVKAAEGKILRVGLLAGSPILSPFLEYPVVVHRGQKVLLTLTARTMTIRTSTVALEDGRVGDSIEVENPDSQKTMRATVLADGSVEMKF
jgi:flagellar basal body P-ring formation protein FlgA